MAVNNHVRDSVAGAKARPSSVVAYSGAHPAHQKMFAGCCAESIKMLGDWSTDEPVSSKEKLRAYLSTARRLRSSAHTAIVIEGTTPAVLMAPFIKLLNHRKKSIIVLSADDALYRAFIADRGFKAVFTRFGFRYIDGVIAIGGLVAELAKKHVRQLPIDVRFPEISEARQESLAMLAPSANSHTMLLIGGRDAHYKGVDIAVSCFKILQKRIPDARLIVIGFPELTTAEGIEWPGPVKDIIPYLSSSSVLIHPGRGDSFPVAVLEAALAGVTPFVSEWTGNASLLRNIDPELVAPLDPEEFANRIATFWESSPEHRQELSAKCKKAAMEYVEEIANQPSLAPFIEHIAHINKSRG